MANTIRIQAWLDDHVSAPLNKIKGATEGIGKSKGFNNVMQGVGIGIGLNAYAALGAGIAKVGEFVSDSIGKASDLNETLSKSNVVFGANAKQVESWGGTLAKSFAITKQAGIEAAASFGNVFTNIGIGRDEAAKMSESLVELAGDLASFNNIDTGDALEKLRSGLAGEAEPLRAVGVFLTEAKVKAKAMELGLVGANGELTEGAKITARYKLILEQTTTAQGDFARTADGLANSQRMLNAELEDAQATLGEKLLPIQLNVTRAEVALLEAVTRSSLANQVLMGTVDGLSLTYEQQAEVLAELEGAYDSAGDAEKGRIDALKANIDAQGRLNTQMDRGKDGLRGLASASIKAKDGLHGVLRQSNLLKDSFHNLTAKANEWSDWVYDELEGEDDLKNKLSLTNIELKTAKKHLHELEEIKHPTKDQRADIAETRVQVDGLEKDAFTLKAQLALLGHAPSAKALAKWLDARDGDLTHLDKKTRDWILHLRQAAGLYNSNFSGGNERSSTATGGHAAGGWVGLHGPELSWVGEKGPEYIIPNHDLKSGGGAMGGGITVNVYPSGVMTPATVRSISDELGPGLYDYLYRRGALGRGN